MNAIIWVIISLIAGAVFDTLWGFLWTKLKHPNTKFNTNYFFSMLIAMVVSLIVVPFILNNQTISTAIAPVVLFGCFGIGYMLNSIVNTVLTYFFNQIEELNKLRVNANALSAVARRTIEIIIAIFLIGLVLITGVYAAVTYSATIGAVGNITGVGVTIHSDANGLNTLTTLDFGTMEPGASSAKIIYIKNIGNIPIKLTFITNTYVPTTSQNYLSLAWNYASVSIPIDTVIPVTYTLTALTSAPSGTTFSFNIVVTAIATY